MPSSSKREIVNTAGGTVVVGVEDNTRRVRGVAEPHLAEERLASIVADSIEPKLLPDIDVMSWRKTYVLAVTVHPSGLRPHHFKSEGADGGTYVRVGSTNRRADPQLRSELARYSRGETFDAQPMPELKSAEIDFRLVSESFSGFRDVTKRDLETLRLLTRYQGRLVPTVAGVVLFGQNRLSYFPDAWIQVGRFGGTNKSEILDRVEITSNLVGAVGETIHHINRHLSRSASIGPVRRRDRWSLPPVAIREGLMNAIVHCDYSQTGAPIRIAIFDDRVEIDNPGLLPLGLTTEDLIQGISKLRNPIVARVFYEIDSIEQWGSGIQRMIAACREAGHPPPKFAEVGTRVRVTMYFQKSEVAAENAVDDAILKALTEPAGLTTSDIARKIGRTPRRTRTLLSQLVDRGLIVSVGKGPNDPRRRFHLTR